MRVLQLIHPTGHPYWNEGEFGVITPDGLPVAVPKESGMGYKIEVRPDGIYYVPHYCGSGFGKVPCNDNRHPEIKLVDANQYDTIQYVGSPLVQSDTLKEDLIQNGIL
ncbi:MAG: hypothetical protein JNK98_04110 [Chitinophagaceae bacterium]|nr:hypothetical protein [Chitinophagaceae bacterium]